MLYQQLAINENEWEGSVWRHQSIPRASWLTPTQNAFRSTGTTWDQVLLYTQQVHFLCFLQTACSVHIRTWSCSRPLLTPGFFGKLAANKCNRGLLSSDILWHSLEIHWRRPTEVMVCPVLSPPPWIQQLNHQLAPEYIFNWKQNRLSWEDHSRTGIFLPSSRCFRNVPRQATIIFFRCSLVTLSLVYMRHSYMP